MSSADRDHETATFNPRLLPPKPVATLAEYTSMGGGVALDQARRVEPAVLIEEVAASGLRGRGGAGFPTGEKWRTIADAAAEQLAASVVVNGAEGEPGTFKDRTLLTHNPYLTIEGALIAARAVGAAEVVIALKSTFAEAIARVRAAVDEVVAAGWTDGVSVRVVEGPDRYLLGEETALLEVVAGRAPLPRTAPPYRRGVVDVVRDPGDERAGEEAAGDQPAEVVMAGEGAEHVAPPALVNNVETLANVPAIIARGAAWFREEGTAESPGTILATATGSVGQHGVHEVAMGTTLAELVELAGGPAPGTTLRAVIGGVSAVPVTDLRTPITYEGFAAAGSGLGSASFVFLGDDVDPLALAAGVSRFLAVESCAQCTACKVDGLAIADALARLCANEGEETDVETVESRLATVADGARCAIGRQHQEVVGGVLAAFPGALDAHRSGAATAVEPMAVGAVASIDQGVATVAAITADDDPWWSGLQTDAPPQP